MYSYIIKKGNDNLPILIRRISGKMDCSKRITPELMADLILDGIIEHEHIILHYSKVDDEGLYKLVKDNQ